MSMDQCAFCSRVELTPVSVGYSTYDCTQLWVELGPKGDEARLEHLVSAFMGPAACIHYQPAGRGYRHFFRYIYIALKRGRATQ